MIIDSHHHLWKYAPFTHAWITDEMKVLQRDFLPKEFLDVLNKHSVEGCVVVQASQTEEETEFLLSLANEYEFIKGVVGWVDLKSPDLELRLEYFSQFKKLKGFRHVVQSEPAGFLSDTQFIEGVRKLNKFNFTYDLLIYHYQLKEAVSFLQQVTDVNIVVDHLAKPSIKTKELASWKSYMRIAAYYDNVYCKVSGMVTEADWHNWREDDFIPYLDEVFAMFGTQRVMYGSDWPVCLLAASYEKQLSLIQRYLSGFSDGEKELVMGKNAKIFYNLY